MRSWFWAAVGVALILVLMFRIGDCTDDTLFIDGKEALFDIAMQVPDPLPATPDAPVTLAIVSMSAPSTGQIGNRVHVLNTRAVPHMISLTVSCGGVPLDLVLADEYTLRPGEDVTFHFLAQLPILPMQLTPGEKECVVSVDGIGSASFTVVVGGDGEWEYAQPLRQPSFMDKLRSHAACVFTGTPVPYNRRL